MSYKRVIQLRGLKDKKLKRYLVNIKFYHKAKFLFQEKKKVEGDLNARTRESPLEPGTVKPQALLLLQLVLNLEWVEEVLQGLVGLK